MMLESFADYHLNPYAYWQAESQGRAVYWSEDVLNGAWIVTDYALCETVLRDSARFSAARTGGWVGRAMHDKTSDKLSTRLAGRAFQQLFARAMLFLDAPDHQRLRALMQPYFKPAALNALRDSIEQRASFYCDAMAARLHADKTVDFVAYYARPLPAQVVAEFLGLESLSLAEHEALQTSSRQIAVFIGALAPSALELTQAQQGLAQMADFFTRVMQEQRIRKGSLLDTLQQASQADIQLSQVEYLAQCIMLLFAGHETTRHLLGSSLLHLLQNRDQWELLCAQPALIPDAVREVLRYEPPVQYTGRRVRHDTTLGEVPMQSQQLVIACIALAQRDCKRYTEAERFKLDREEKTHLAFGTGAHICIGALFTQMEAEITLRMLTQRWPNLAYASHKWDASTVAYRGLQELLLELA